METPLDDSQLLRLAADPRTRLFPEPSRTAVLAPLVIVLALLPALVIVQTPGFDETSSRWGLRTLDVAMARELSGWLQPGREGFGRSLAYQPPLASWLQAAVVRAIGIERPVGWHVVSFLATCGCVVAMYRLARRLGGASFSLVVVACLSCHPLTLRLATGTTPGAIGLLLMVVTVWGLLGHLEGPPLLVSFRLLIGALAWGLALLAVGPVALALLPPLLLHVGGLRGGQGRAASGSSLSGIVRSVWSGTTALLILIATGLSFSSWWEVMMLSEYETAFWCSWWTGSLLSDPSSITLSHSGRGWIADNTLLCGWLLIGLAELLRHIWQPSSELSRRRHQLVGLWWLMALAARIVFEFFGPRESVQRETWDAFLLLPTLLIVGSGVEAVVRRQTSPLTEALLIASTAGFIIWRVTGRPTVGLIAFVSVLAALALFPAFASRWRVSSHGWSERNWRRFLQVFVVAFLTSHMVMGLIARPRPTTDDAALIELRQRLETLPPVRRITLIAVNAAAPASLSFLLHSRWPSAQLTIAEAWNAEFVEKTILPTKTDGIEDLVVEWSRRDARLTAENFANYQAMPVGDPIRYEGRKLALYIIGPHRR